MKPALVLPPEPCERWKQAAQIGIEHVVVHTLELGDGSRPYEFDELLRMKTRFEDHGLEIAAFEGGVPLTDATRLATDGRDEEIARFKTLLRNLGTLDIPVVCYDWMAGLRWARTSTTVPARGDSRTSAYDDELMRRGPRPAAADTTAEELWTNLESFLAEVVPVAEEAGVKLGLHPDDPPIDDVRGMPRIINSPDAYERVLDCYESEYNGITFCQGNFAAMSVDVPATIRRFGDRINFVHFRDVEQTENGFVETWHDDGPTDMLAAMEAYADVGFDGPIRPDHVPTMAGEPNENPGYEMNGRLFAVGYMKGLLESAER
ncbi:mannonate dehydratase [Haladaptatus sp. AB618]|uniref:mannonate dehydratase n=1 Tax=Haladaptatus sp. AB618 TaxID=2934173 RepID=UPI0034E973D3